MADVKNKYPLVIIGLGPAGLTASIYASRYKIKHLVIGQALGGLAFEAYKICNFPTEQEISGLEIVEKMKIHAESLGASLLIDKVIKVAEENKVFKIITQKGNIFWSEALLLATGTKHRQMNLPNEEKFIGRGVSYCAICDAVFYKGKTVAVVGGSNNANISSLYLARIAKKVYQIYRRDKLRGETAWIDQVKSHKKIEVVYNTKIVGLEGKEKLENIILDKHYRGAKKIAVDGLFVEIGTMPQQILTEELSLKTDKNNYIKVSLGQKTSCQGVWAAGDITTASNNFRQIITACSEGAIAAENIFKFLQKSFKE